MIKGYEELKTFLEKDETHLMVGVAIQKDNFTLDINEHVRYSDELVECLECTEGSYVLVTETKTIELDIKHGDLVEYYSLVYSTNPYIAMAWAALFDAGLITYNYKIKDGRLLTYNIEKGVYEEDENSKFLEDY